MTYSEFFSDPGQSGQSVLLVSLGSHNIETKIQTLPILQSLGESSKSGRTSARVFNKNLYKLKMAPMHIYNILKIITKRKLQYQGSVHSVPDSLIKEAYGSKWNNAGEWFLIDAGIGQEVYNPNHFSSNSKRASIAAEIFELKIQSVP